MAIKDADRKRLWGRAGNRCAKCRKILAVSSENGEAESILGEEAHILPKSASGPRGDDSWGGASLDAYENLILLCPSDHTLVDTQPKLFSRAVLMSMKQDHERWVEHTLGEAPEMLLKESGQVVVLLQHVSTGSVLCDIICGAHQQSVSTDEPNDAAEMELLKEFCELVDEYGNSYDEIVGGSLVEIKFKLTRLLSLLTDVGFSVFAALESKAFVYTSLGITKTIPMNVFVMNVLRSENEYIHSDGESSFVLSLL